MFFYILLPFNVVGRARLSHKGMNYISRSQLFNMSRIALNIQRAHTTDVFVIIVARARAARALPCQQFKYACPSRGPSKSSNLAATYGGIFRRFMIIVVSKTYTCASTIAVTDREGRSVTRETRLAKTIHPSCYFRSISLYHSYSLCYLHDTAATTTTASRHSSLLQSNSRCLHACTHALAACTIRACINRVSRFMCDR